MHVKDLRPYYLLLLRLVTLGLRFLFVALFFRYSEALYGEYGLVATTVMAGVYLLGFEFYTFAQRELLRTGISAGRIFAHQLIFYGFAYLILLPLFSFFFHAGFLSETYLRHFYVLLVVEHLSFEIHRMLFVLRHPLAANINLFFRNGFWMLPVIWRLWQGSGVDISYILKWWIAGDVLSWLPLAAARRELTGRWGGGRPDLKWIAKGIRTGFPSFLAVLSFKIIEFSDRYLLDYFYDKAMVGIYTFFGNLSVLVHTVVATTVISLRYPSLVETVLSGDRASLLLALGQFKRLAVRWSISAVTVLWVALPILLIALGKENRLNYYHVFILLTASQLCFNLSLVYHYILYGMQKDRLLLRIAFTAMVLNVGLNMIFIPRWGMTGAALTTWAAMVWIWAWKRYAVRKALHPS